MTMKIIKSGFYLFLMTPMYQFVDLSQRLVFWTNGGIKEVAGVYKMLPLLFKAVHEQTGVLPPALMGTLTLYYFIYIYCMCAHFSCIYVLVFSLPIGCGVFC